VACGRSLMSEECKNIKGGITQSCLDKYLEVLTTRKQTNPTGASVLPSVLFLAVSALTVRCSIEDALQRCVGEWVVFHLPARSKWKCFEVCKQPKSRITRQRVWTESNAEALRGDGCRAVKPRVLILLEVGLDTYPFNNAQTAPEEPATSAQPSWRQQSFHESTQHDEETLCEDEVAEVENALTGVEQGEAGMEEGDGGA